MNISIGCVLGFPDTRADFLIKEHDAGFPQADLDLHDGTESTNDARDLEVCGAQDFKNAVCFEQSESAIYQQSRAVAMLYVVHNGVTTCCTGWLVVSSEHIVSSSDHGIEFVSPSITFYYRDQTII
jgi:hypothetical protein